MNAPPEWLAQVARDEWTRVQDQLGECDPVTLTAYCQMYARWRDAENQLDVNGTEVVIKNESGDVIGAIASPQITIAQKYAGQMLRLWKALLSRRRA